MYSNGLVRARNRHFAIHAVLGLWLLCLALCWPGIARAQAIVVSPAGGLLPSATAGGSYSQVFSASGGTAPYTYSVSGNLPAGMAMDPASGTFSGRPTQRGTFNFTVRATDSTGATGDTGYSLTVSNPSLSLSPASATAIQGEPFTHTLTSSGGVAPHSYALETGMLPAGLTLGPGGVISGTTLATSDIYPVTLRVTDGSTGPGSYFELESFTVMVTAAPSVSIAVSPASVSEDGATNLVYTVTRSLNLFSPTVVNLTTSGTATSGTDYTGALASVTIPAGATTATVVIDPIADTIVEANETVIITVANGSGYTVGAPSSATGTILNDDVPSATIAVSPASVAEDSGTALVYTVTLNQPSLSPLSINFNVGGTAASGNDYLAVSSPLTIPAGDTSGTISIMPIADTDVEANDTVVISLGAGAGYTVGAPSSATGSIVDDDQPRLSINDVTQNEGNSGSTAFTFTISLSAPAGPGGVSFSLATANATAVAGTDYTAISGTRVIPAGQQSTTFDVTVLGNTRNEADKTFLVNVSKVIGATVLDGQGVGTIVNDDPLPSLSINDISVTEGDSGLNMATFTVSLSAASGRSVTLNYASSDGTATAGSDYVATSGSLTLLPGNTSTTISVPVQGDTLFEADETFNVVLSSPVNATMLKSTGVATILNDDQPITVSPSSLPNPTVGMAYSQTLSASGGSYTYAITAGTLPVGLTLGSGGVLSGTPTSAGSYPITVTATDTSAAPGPYVGAQSYVLTVGPPTLVLAGGPLPAATLTQAYSAPVGPASGGTAPYTYAITSGSLPAGLTLAIDGTISGTATAMGTFSFTVTATDSSSGVGAPFSVSTAMTISVADTLPLAGNASLTVAYGAPATPVTLVLSGGAATSVAVDTAPQHGTASVTGPTAISYQPVAGFAGNDSFTYTASNGTGSSAPATVTVTVGNPVITVSANGGFSAVAGTAYSQTFSWTGGAAPYSGFQVTNLPAGLSITASTADSVTVSGTPTQAGSFNLLASATDSSTGNGPFTIGQSFALAVASPTLTLAPTVVAVGTAGTAYAQTFSASGGIAPYTYSVSGNLPAGLVFDAASGTLSGTPTQAGSFPISVTATDSTTGTAATVSGSYTLSVTAPTLTLAPGTLPGGTAGIAYAQTFSASGGIAPYTYSVSGNLSAGLTFDPASATVSGLPTEAGSFTLSLTVTDSTTGTPASLVQPYVLQVAVPVISLSPGAGALPEATRGSHYEQVISASGGVAPYRFVARGELPPGISMDAASGVLAGVAEQAGQYSLQVEVSDSTGGTVARATQTYQLQVVDTELVITPDTLPGAAYGQAYRQQLTVSGGSAPYQYTVVAGSLPSGLSLSADGQLSGTLAADGNFSFRIRVADSQGNQAEQAYVLQVALRPDPTADAEVRALLSAQVETARRFASAQSGNFKQRMQRLHGASRNGGFSNNLSLVASGAGAPVCDAVITVYRNDGRCDPQRRQPFDHEPLAAPGVQADNNAELGLWLGGSLRSGRDSNTQGRGTDFQTDGLSLGADYRFAKDLVAGAGVGYGRDRSDVGNLGSRSDGQALSMVLYASYSPGQHWFVDALAGYQLLDYQLRRHVLADGSFVHGHRDGQQWFGSLSLGADLARGDWQFTPYAGIEVSRGTLNGFAESGNALYSLAYADQDVDVATGNAGLRVQVRRQADWGIWTPRMGLEFQHDFQGSGMTAMQYTNAGAMPWYQTRLDSALRNRWLLGIGVDLEWGNHWGLRMDYNGLLDADARDNGVQFSLERRL